MEVDQEKEGTERDCSPLNPSSGIPTVDGEKSVSIAGRGCGGASYHTHLGTRRPWRRSPTPARPPAGQHKQGRQFRALVSLHPLAASSFAAATFRQMMLSGTTPRLPSVAESSVRPLPSMERFWSNGATEKACMICTVTQ